MRKWRWIGHVVRKDDELIEKQILDCNPQEARGEEDRRRLRKGPILRKKKKCGETVC
jgi:hypothetical protein